MSSLENNGCLLEQSWMTTKIGEKIKFKYNLMSYYYIRNQRKKAEYIRNRSQLIYIDSGAHSFQKGKKVRWNQYIQDYCDFIKWFDRPNVLGYFEMDIDKIIGYKNVIEMRKQLLKTSSKIIPVWHKNRGVQNYIDMCKEYSGKIVAISGFKNEDIRDEDFPYFVKVAQKYGAKLHCLGMGREKIMKANAFYSVDNSSWKQPLIYARYRGKKIDSNWIRSLDNRQKLEMNLYLDGIKKTKKVETWWV